jgi:tetratricopeptide (TPR) repeat protein
MAIKGSLVEAGLADVCQLLSIGMKTGCLSVTDQSRFGQIFFDQGRITFATIINRRDRLGDLLLRDGAITHAQLMEAVEEQRRGTDRRLGQILLERGYIDDETLTGVIRHQVEEAVYYLFTWHQGNFHFEPGRTPDPGEVLNSMNPETLLLEGARRVDEWSVIEKKITSVELIFELDHERLESAQVQLTPEQKAVVPLMNGKRSVHELAERSGLVEFAAAKAVYGLVQAGFATRVGRRVVEAEGEGNDGHDARNLGIAFYRTGMVEDAEREFRRVLQSEPLDGTARHYLALLALRQRRPELAVRRITALLESVGPQVGAYLNLAYALRLQRRFEDGERVLRDAQHLAPSEPRIRLARGANTLFAGDAEGAAQQLREYRGMLSPAEVPPPTFYYCAALAEAVAARLDQATALIEEGLDSHPGCAPLLLLRGNVAERRADMVAAETAYQKAAEEDPTLAQAHRNLGDLAHRRNALQEALEHYQRAAEADPDLGDDLYTRMADIYYKRNERERAIRSWRRAIELNPSNEVARSHLEVVARVSR